MGTIEGSRSSPGAGHSSGLIVRAVEISTAQMRALNVTPHTLVPTPGTGKAIVVEGFSLSKPSGTAFSLVAAGEDLEFRYSDAAGLKIAEAETTGLLNVNGERHRWVSVYRSTSDNSAIEPVNNGAIVVTEQRRDRRRQQGHYLDVLPSDPDPALRLRRQV